MTSYPFWFSVQLLSRNIRFVMYRDPRDGGGFGFFKGECEEGTRRWWAVYIGHTFCLLNAGSLEHFRHGDDCQRYY